MLADTANPSAFIEGDKPAKAAGWRTIRTCKIADGVVVDVWLEIRSSLASFGMADSFGVPDAWRQDGEWFHTYRGRPTQLERGYITHWRPKP